ncbi:hypothetical protein BCR44DRAFT_1482536 [Catenaria anguillulae PL171]|uniref:Uncharacterized protein n=1 Tax=Catenaria anguillulae PL171 TaxID=765915 RepID=A0A1Y2HZF4_9FUNG|nr:hypothetical protein BCR44DRAFT_1482536 [Catenaria anguillulae PL171]
MNSEYNPSPGTQGSRTPGAIAPPPPPSSNQSNLLLAHATNTQFDMPDISPGTPLGAIVSGMGTFNNLDDIERFLASTSTADLQSMLSSVEGQAPAVHYAPAAPPPVTPPAIDEYQPLFNTYPALPSTPLMLLPPPTHPGSSSQDNQQPMASDETTDQDTTIAGDLSQVGPVTSVVPALPAVSILTDQQPPWTSLVAFRANVVMQEPSMDVDGRVTERYLINVEVLATDPPAVSDTKARTNETRTTLRDIIARFRVADNGLAGHHFAAPYIPNESLPAFFNMDHPTRDAFERVTLTVADSMARAESTNAGFGADIFRIREMLRAALGSKRQIPDGGVTLVTYMFQNGTFLHYLTIFQLHDI